MSSPPHQHGDEHLRGPGKDDAEQLGSHHELVAVKGAYAALWDSWHGKSR
ncbi:hypothetical protein [Acrocarpospora macrocephala]|nr:hypothetical protein [Acrocarpospora macrocephala]